MAKYCVKCGKVLPDGVEICPECNVAAEATEAALFTRITADTEVWKEPTEKKKKKKERVKRTRTQKEKIAYAAAGVVVFAFLIFAILFTRPVPRVVRAVNQGDYDRAVEIYWASEKLVENGSPRIDNLILKKAQVLCDSYAAGEISADDAAGALSKLGALGSGAEELLEQNFSEFRALFRSQEHLAEAEKLFRNKEFLDARAEYLQVAESDADYAAAQEKAAECLNSYAAKVVGEAAEKSAAGDYPAAIAALQTGNLTLEEFGTFSPEIDMAIEACFADYETQLLTEAENLSALQDNDAAAAMIRGGIEDYEMDSEAMTAALDKYLKLARAGHIAAVRGQADEMYAAGEHEVAFALLDEMKDTLEGDTTDIESEIAELEALFAADMISAAKETFAGERDNLPDAIGILEDAIEIRPLEAMTVCRDDFAQYLPMLLESADTAGKTGTVFRTQSAFESVDGTDYDGWIWGENGADVSFKLDGAYDLLEAVFAVRRADNANANGHFEVYCDGEQVFKSETLYHWQEEPMPVSVDVSGCNELRIVFICDYEASTAADGYCYHGLCEPRVVKNMPEA